jgi:iron(II)-dependent oxidoreductase
MRTLNRTELRRAMVEARQYTSAMVSDLDDAQWRVPRLDIVNPMLWEVGHIGWFMEHWCLRWRGPAQPLAPSVLPECDRWYNSAQVAHATRWDLDLPTRAATLRYLDTVLDATLDQLEHADDSAAALYFFQLALYHEQMHGEAFAYTRQTCGYPEPQPARRAEASTAGDVSVPGATFEQGAPRAPSGFVFDNEKWGHAVEVQPFSIARRPVSQREFAAFVYDSGYGRPELWSAPGRDWLGRNGAAHPVYWRRSGDGWEARRFDRWGPLDLETPMLHVNRYEAQAWCNWARRRLPTESEWELAALAGAIAEPAVWEWTASPFLPYPGFQADPYAEYSAPWFETHFSVRGGSFATPPHIVHPRFRNFYTADRADIFIGFRSCALQ